MKGGLGGVFVHLVSFNSARYLERCLGAILAQSGFSPGLNLEVQLTDNASSDGSADLAARCFAERVRVVRNKANLGFCGAHNQGVRAFLNSRAEFMLILNPDVVLAPDALEKLVRTLGADSRAGSAACRLMRAQDDLLPISPPTFDSTGMFMTPSLRHFDRGSGEEDRGQYRQREYVFGATGACVLLKRECIVDLLLEEGGYAHDLYRIYPQLADFRDARAPLFDEAFFAYREDADVAWRAQAYGWRCVYEPEAVGYHKRVVLPERRAELPPELNRLGVRNRFLLQLNNYSLSLGFASFVSGLLLRNLIVVAGVILRERSSLSAFSDLLVLWKRARERRRIELRKARERAWSAGPLSRWFRTLPYSESVS
jgi:GT2 family glycosyltransferase